MTVLYETPRLRVRTWRAGDEPELLVLHGDPAVARWMGDGTPLDAALCAAWVQVCQRNYAELGYGYCRVESREDGRFLGGCGLIHAPGEPRPPVEVLYALRPSEWGRGLAREAVAGMLDWGARACGLARIHATALPDNRASARVLQAVGMRWLHTRPDADGEAVATWVWDAPQPPHSTI